MTACSFFFIYKENDVKDSFIAFKKQAFGEFKRISITQRKEVRYMKRLIKTAIKWAPLLYPIVRKVMNDRKEKQAYQGKGKRK